MFKFVKLNKDFFTYRIKKRPAQWLALVTKVNQKVALRGVLGNAITSRTFCTPVT